MSTLYQNYHALPAEYETVSVDCDDNGHLSVMAHMGEVSVAITLKPCHVEVLRLALGEYDRRQARKQEEAA